MAANSSFKEGNKWLGLILPLVAVCFSILAVFVTPAYVTTSEITSGNTVVEHIVTQSGDVVENIIEDTPQEELPSTASRVFTGIHLFTLYNIPTAILLIIYAICRSMRKNSKELDKMNIQDLS